MLPLKLINCALDLTIYGARIRDRLPFGPRKTLRDDIRDLRDRVRVDGGLGRIA